MKRDSNYEIAIRNEQIKSLEHEGRLKDELIQVQEEMIQSLESHILKLQKLIQEMMSQQNEQKG